MQLRNPRPGSPRAASRWPETLASLASLKSGRQPRRRPRSRQRELSCWRQWGLSLLRSSVSSFPSSSA